LYFVKQPYGSASASAATPNKWAVYAQPENANGSSIGAPTTLTTLGFNTNGTLASGGSATLGVNWGTGAAASNIAFNFAGSTLGAQSFAVGSLTNDGYAAGEFTGPKITSTGAVQATYSNGQTKTVGNITVASFINNQGLIPETGNLYSASPTSGQAVLNAPGAGVSGNLVSGNLEESNASTSNDLVELLKFQQAYQANTSVLQTEQQDSQKLLQL
jgi:flagellar hook protein FlgE